MIDLFYTSRTEQIESKTVLNYPVEGPFITADMTVACPQCLRSSESYKLHKCLRVMKPSASIRSRQAAWSSSQSGPAGGRAQTILLHCLMRTSDIKGEVVLTGLPDAKLV